MIRSAGKTIARVLFVWLFVLFVAPAGGQGDDVDTCPVAIDDHQIDISTPQDVAQKRTELYQYIWGQPTLPTDATVELTPDVPSPIGCSSGILDHVDHLQMDMGPMQDGGFVAGEAWHYVPANTSSVTRRNRLVIVHNGHMAPDACHDTFADGEDGLHTAQGRPYMGEQMTINALLADGFDVLAVVMPNFTQQQCGGGHGILFTPEALPPTGSGMRYFLDPTLRSLNYLLTQQAFEDVSMLGLSGGGWTTTVYAALDPRITSSFPVAGSIPLYLRTDSKSAATTRRFYNGEWPGTVAAAQRSGAGCPVNLGDTEQYIQDMYGIAGYPDLYLMGSYGPGRSQIQILNRRDSCCFGQAEHHDPASYDSDLREYESRVRGSLHRLGAGKFRVQIDEASTIHQISRDAVHNVILASLNHASPDVGAASSGSVAIRGTNGTLWHYSAHGWKDTGFAINGNPSVVENAVHPIDVIARGADNAPVHIFFDGAQWQQQSLPNVSGEVTLPNGTLIGDPAVVSVASGSLDVVALGPHHTTAIGTDLFHWHVTSGAVTLERIAQAPHAVGMPALTTVSDNRLGVYFRSGDTTYTDPAPVPPSSTECVEQPRSPYGVVQTASGEWQPAQRIPEGTPLFTFPRVATIGDETRMLFTSANGDVWESSLTADEVDTRLSNTAPASLLFDGSPTQPAGYASDVAVYARTRDGGLSRFLSDGESDWTWMALPLGAGNGADSIADSPRAIPDAVLWTGRDGQVYRYRSTGIDVLDRTFVDGFDP